MSSYPFYWLSQYFRYYPAFAFVALILGGLNLPFSEDAIIIGGALICQADERLLVPCLLMILAGVFVSDVISYFLGVFAKRGTTRLRWVRSVLNHRYAEKLRDGIHRHGFLTFIVCRFIPFGVRNTLFISSGFFGLSLHRFLLVDTTALLISVNTLFWLVFLFGEAVERQLYVAGGALFVLLMVLAAAAVVQVIVFLVKRKRSEKDAGS